MSTFIGQLIGFAVVVWLIVKFVAPQVRKLMVAQKATVQTQLDESKEASKRLANADQYHARRVAEAQEESQSIVGEARSDSTRISQQLREQGVVEAERLKLQGDQQIALMKAQMVRQMKTDLGGATLRRATEIVREHVSEPAAQAATVDRFLDQLDAMAPTDPSHHEIRSAMRASSRDAQSAVNAQFEREARDLSAEGLSEFAADTAAVASLLAQEPVLARTLADSVGEPEAKRQLTTRIFGTRVAAPTLRVLEVAVQARWSAAEDLIEGLRQVARSCLLERADKEGEAEVVAEQLFRFGRLLEANPKLTGLLSDYSEPAQGRKELVGSMLGPSAGALPITEALVAQEIGFLRGIRADDAIDDLAELAVTRRGELVAHVTSAASLKDEQRSRLGEILARIYRNRVAIQLTIDEGVLGGLSVAVGDEVIDGTVASRLTAAATSLPD